MKEPQEPSLSNDEMAEINEILGCSRPARFILWAGEDPAQAQPSDGAVPCGTELLSQGLTRGWEICERCIKHPILKGALFFGLK